MEKVTHGFPAFVKEDATILILGSIPSAKSREEGFYYMHPQNRFWKVLADVYEEPYPETLADKQMFLEKHQIALYDVLESCWIEGSKDDSIREPVPTKLLPILQKSQITRVYITGKKAYSIYQKYQEKEIELQAIPLPSTSPLNAKMSERELVEAYQVIREKELAKFIEPLLFWYKKNKRDLPWRNTSDPYSIWISEIMLQQTRVEAVKHYYEQFLNTFPTILSLKEAKEDVLLKCWEGLGYYSRARNLQKTAEILVHQYDGKFPKDYKEILRLPGIGSYTAGAITSIAFHEPNPAVDGNVFRVVSRLLALFEDITKPITRVKMEHRVKEVLTRANAGTLNQAFMELGATVCLPKGAKCNLCPLKFGCLAYQKNLVDLLPVKSKKEKKKEVKKTILLLECNDRYAVLKRENKGLLEGLYQFPEMEYTKVQKEVITWCKERQMMPLYLKALENKKHLFTHLIWKMNGFYVRVEDENPNFKWVTLEELSHLSIPSAYSYYHPDKNKIYF